MYMKLHCRLQSDRPKPPDRRVIGVEDMESIMQEITRSCYRAVPVVEDTLPDDMYARYEITVCACAVRVLCVEVRI